jgi:plastocyanin
METGTTTTDRRRWLDVVPLVIAIVGFALVMPGIVNIVQDDDPPRAKIMSAEQATQLGLPVVELGELFIRGELEIAPGAKVAVVNIGAAPHNLTVTGDGATADLDGDEATEFDVSMLTPGTYEVYCSIPGHREGGMEGELVVR